MLPGYKIDSAALRPLLQLTDAVLITPKELGLHLRYSHENLSLMRRKNQGPAWIKLPSGGVRYRMSEVLAWELEHGRGPLTLERITLAILGCAEVPIEHRAKINEHLQRVLG